MNPNISSAFDIHSLSPGVAQKAQADFLTRWLYPVANQFFTAPGRLDTYVGNKVEANRLAPSLLKKYLINPSLLTVNWLYDKVFNFDFKTHLKVGKMHIAQPPIGAFTFMILPMTIVPRLNQARKRAAEGDDSEFGDILRRDILTLITMLYALDPLKKLLTRKVQEKVGLRLMGDGDIYNPADTKLYYKLDSPQTLATILQQKEHNAQNIVGALKRTLKPWLDTHLISDSADIKQVLNELNTTLDTLSEATKTNATRKVNTLSKTIFEKMQFLETWRLDRMKGLGPEISSKFSLLPSLPESLVHYADRVRLPISVVSFALVAIGIGWFPVWFNKWWHDKKKTMPQQKNDITAPMNTSSVPFDAVSAYQALKGTSRLSQGFYT